MTILEKWVNLFGAATVAVQPQLTYRVVLGALLTLVSQADGKITAAEEQAKRKILAANGFSNPEEQTQILVASQQAIADRMDWEGFTREVNDCCEYPDRVKLVQDLFRVAWADHELSHVEIETIRKIANLLWVDHKDFIAAKIATNPDTHNP